MATKTEQKLKSARLTRDIYRLALQGHRGTEIARQLGCYPSTVSDTLKRGYTRLHDHNLALVFEIRARELAKLDVIETEAWQAWERSKRDRKTTKTATTGTDGAGVRGEVTTDEQTGDPAYLQVVHRCIERRARMLGLDAQPLTPNSGELAPTNFNFVKIILPDNGREAPKNRKLPTPGHLGPTLEASEEAEEILAVRNRPI